MNDYENTRTLKRARNELLDIRRQIFDMQRSLKQIEKRVDDLFDKVLSERIESPYYEPYRRVTKREDAVRLLIGELPVVLLSKKFFPDNRSLIEFAQTSLNLPISLTRKRSRREIIGVIITEVAKLDLNKIRAFRETLSVVLQKQPKSRTDFFDFWEKTIRSMPIGR